MESPHAAYHRHLLESQTRLARSQSWDRRLGYAKIAVFLTIVGSAVLFLHAHGLWGLLLAMVLVFILLLVVHERVLRSVRDRQRVTDFYQRSLARLEDRWGGTGETGDRFLDPAHPYARDLDLFGSGSLFELLCTARTRAGEETLARWLLHAAPPAEVRERQTAVLDMKDRLHFREQLFAAGESVRTGIHPEALAAWGELPPVKHALWMRIVCALLAAAWLALAFFTFVLAVDDLRRGAPPPSWIPLLVLSLFNAGVSRWLNRRLVAPSLDGTENAASDLQLLSEVLAILEQEPFQASRLRTLQTALGSHGIAASRAVRRLSRIAQWAESRRNLVVVLLDLVTLYRAQLIFAIEHWRAEFGSGIRGWLDAAGQCEALSAIAGYAFEHPADVMPEFVETRPYFEAEALAHPLLPAAQAVGNDLTLGHPVQLIIISGPNMAGKSTFLRGVGLNAVLAQCGAPVRARRLRLSPLAVGASICVLDSLQGGVSRFYAEIRRLKVLADLAAGPDPLLFLLDELLSGTNSHDRFDGTRFVVRALVRLGAVGLVTTHDLALTRIPETMDGIAGNCHFEDSLRDGHLHFDYILKPGVVQTSNALKLMRSVGLEVDE